MEAVAILKELNATGARKVPDHAPADFVPVRWEGYLEQAAESKDVTAYRHFWELTVLLGLRDGLRSGDVYVPSSRRYADPASYLFTPEQWTGQRDQFCQLVGKPASARVALEGCKEELQTAMEDLEKVLGNRAAGVGEVRLSDRGDPIIPPLSAEDVPAEAASLRDELSELLPLAPIASLLVELDRRTGFLDCLTHAGGKQSRSPELKRNLLAVLIANATNLGLVRMAEACGISYDILAWTQEWYIREETLAAANAAIVNYHHRLPMTQAFGGGTLSSSDGQRFPVQGKSTTARVMKKYFAGQGLSTYTHVSDQHSTFGTKVIVVTRREAQYVLDEIMGNKTDLPITEHATDTHGVTLVNFALFDLVGMQLSPRIRDLGKITLYRMDPQRDVGKQWPVAGPLLTQKINMGLIEEKNWDDLLRLAASIKFGHATASLIVGKLSASSRQNTLAAALKEYGALRRTIYGPLPGGRDLPPHDRPAAQQGQVPALPASGPALRPPGQDPRTLPGRADRTGLVPDRAHRTRPGRLQATASPAPRSDVRHRELVAARARALSLMRLPESGHPVLGGDPTVRWVALRPWTRRVSAQRCRGRRRVDRHSLAAIPIPGETTPVLSGGWRGLPARARLRTNRRPEASRTSVLAAARRSASSPAVSRYLVRWMPSLQKWIDKVPDSLPGFGFACFEPRPDTMALNGRK